MTVVDKEGESGDTCHIELDDCDAKLPIPPDDAVVTVRIGWHNEGQYEIFSGKAKDIESGFGRKHGGRRLWIDSYGANIYGDGASPTQRHWGEGAPPDKKEGEMVSLSQVGIRAQAHITFCQR